MANHLEIFFYKVDSTSNLSSIVENDQFDGVIVPITSQKCQNKLLAMSAQVFLIPVLGGMDCDSTSENSIEKRQTVEKLVEEVSFMQQTSMGVMMMGLMSDLGTANLARQLSANVDGDDLSMRFSACFNALPLQEPSWWRFQCAPHILLGPFPAQSIHGSDGTIFVPTLIITSNSK